MAFEPPPTQASSLVADHALEIADHDRIRVRAVGRAEYVMRAADVRDPVAHRLVDRFFQSLLPRLHGHDFRTEHVHAIDIEPLPLAIDRAHVDHALHAEHGTHRGGGDAVLAGARLGDDPLFAHAFCQEDLAHRVVDLVRAGVEQVLALEIDLRATQFTSEPLGVIERRRPAAELAEVVLQLALELGIFLGAEIFRLQLLERMHQRLGHVTSAVRSEVTLRVRHRFSGDSTHVGGA
jgi:hypothetical protein